MSKFIRLVSAILTVAGFAVATDFAVSPAQASVTVMYGFNYENNARLYAIDPTTASVSPPIGGWNNGFNNPLGAAWNPSTGNITALAYDSEQDECEIWEINTSTGVATFIFRTTGFNALSCSGLTYGLDHNIYLGYKSSSTLKATLAQVNPQTGVLIANVWTEGVNGGNFNFINMDFSRGLMYFQTNTGDDDIFTYNPTTGVTTNLTNGSDPGTYYGVVIGSAGEIYASTWGDLITATSWEALCAGTTTYVGSLLGNMASIVAEYDYPAAGGGAIRHESNDNEQLTKRFAVSFDARSTVLTQKMVTRIKNRVSTLPNRAEITNIVLEASIPGRIQDLILASFRDSAVKRALRKLRLRADIEENFYRRGVNTHKVRVIITYVK